MENEENVTIELVRVKSNTFLFNLSPTAGITLNSSVAIRSLRRPIQSQSAALAEILRLRSKSI